MDVQSVRFWNRKWLAAHWVIQVICLLEKPFTQVTHPESSDSSKGRKGFIRKKRFARQCWSQRRKMHLTFDRAIVESICPHRSKAQTLMTTAQVWNTQPYNGMKGRPTHPGKNKAAASYTALLNIQTLEAARTEKSEGITGKVGIELSSAMLEAHKQQLSFLLSSHGETVFKSVADAHKQKSLNAPNPNPQQTLLPWALKEIHQACLIPQGKSHILPQKPAPSWN